MRQTRAFTLIELLVVITIIVVLLALLAPAMDQAIYQAELAVCGTRLKGIADGLSIYTVDYKRKYPHRPLASGDPGGKPNNVYIGNVFEQSGGANDDRASLQGYISINGHLNDSLSPREVDFENSARQTQIEVSYHLWFGWQYHVPNRERGMFKMGDRFEWTPPSAAGPVRTYSFDFLASDVDAMDGGVNNGQTIAGHPDVEGKLRESVLQDGSDVAGTAESDTLQYTFSRWSGDAGRGAFDSQFVSSDTSVRRYVDVLYDESEELDPQMVRAPMWPAGYPFGQWQVHLGL